MRPDFTYYEFFAGGGLARLGLGPGWRCLFANDISATKGESYRANFDGADELLIADINDVRVANLPERATLAWASFPCQDLSLAGAGRGIDGERSGAFWPFWRLLLQLQRDGRGVPVVVIENVVGLLSSNNGQDFVQLSRVIAEAGYNLGALVINADRFVPQSRPRLFIIAVDRSWDIAEELVQFAPYGIWQPKHLIAAYKRLPAEVKKRWLWWNLPMPPKTPPHLRELIEREPEGVEWHTAEETQRLLSLMSDANLAKVKAAQAIGKLHVGTIYKRTRKKDGKSVQRAEVRFDGISGCLRTPAGGSSRQIILVVEGDSVRSRLLSPREAARLMGLSDTYLLPARYNEAYHLMGDAVVVPVIAWIERHILRELVRGQNTKADKASQEWRASQLSLADF
jgi:DNA (cytosine-5)-methyltransferase 1